MRLIMRHMRRIRRGLSDEAFGGGGGDISRKPSERRQWEFTLVLSATCSPRATILGSFKVHSIASLINSFIFFSLIVSAVFRGISLHASVVI